jgi:hypothetical protein
MPVGDAIGLVDRRRSGRNGHFLDEKVEEGDA